MGDGGPEAKVHGPLFWLKLQFPALFRPILASVSFRQRPWASADFRLHINCPIQTTWHAGGGPEAKVSGPLFSLDFSAQCRFVQF